MHLPRFLRAFSMCTVSARRAIASKQHHLTRAIVRASFDMSRRLIPLLDRVLVQKVAAPEKSIGGVLLPETASKVRVCTVRPEASGGAISVTSGRQHALDGCWPSQRRCCMRPVIGMQVQQAHAADCEAL
jgi:Chaperonin 10 Kd subunit